MFANRRADDASAGVLPGRNADMPLVRLKEFEAEWGKRYPSIGQAWRGAWEHVVPFSFAPSVRKMIYTTNAVETLHRSLRKIMSASGAPGCPTAQSFHKAHQTNGRSLIGYVMDTTPSLVGPPVHPFRLVGELLTHVWASAQSHAYLL
jgi:hypothetical protein